MNIRKFASSSLASQVAIVLILALLLWFSGLPFINHAQAARVTNFTDTLYHATPSALSSSTIQFTLQNGVTAGTDIRISLDPTGTSPSGSQAFSEVGSTATSSDFILYDNGTLYQQVADVGSCAADRYYVTANYNNATDEYVQLNFCAGGATIASGHVLTLYVGALTNVWTNPSVEQSYVIRLSGTAGVTGDTRVAIINDVTVTASVDTSFTFAVYGTNAGTSVIGTTTRATTTATTIPFGTLPIDRAVSATQRLSVATNASHGFAVTVQENNPLTDTSNDIIYLFNQGATTSNPTPWLAPSSTITRFNTYGHFGVTSADDYVFPGGATYANGTKYVGSIITPQIVFEQNGPADGITDSIGSTTVGYTIQIGPLQAAGDYTNILRYVATPTF